MSKNICVCECVQAMQRMKTNDRKKEKKESATWTIAKDRAQ